MIVLRPATEPDVGTCVAVQRAATVVGYAHIFDQALYPFPATAIHEEWASRLAGDTKVTVAIADGEPVGVVGVKGNRVEGLFVVPERRGTGVADRLHDDALAQIAARQYPEAVLDVLADNVRAGAFYERRGWLPTGESRPAPWPPYPELVGYRRPM